MNAWILLAALLCGPPAVEDGSLLFLEHSNRVVESVTGSAVTHVAVILHEEHDAWVYEATPSEVRRILLEDYYFEIGKLNQRRADDNKIRVWLAQPREPYSAKQIATMRELLAAQIGRRYSVKSYVRGESDGSHCAELASRSLCAASALEIERCQAMSPGALFEQIKPISRPLATIAIAEPTEVPDWYTRASGDWLGFCTWCQWSCWEAWMFCW